jgi:hypothetical protein
MARDGARWRETVREHNAPEGSQTNAGMQQSPQLMLQADGLAYASEVELSGMGSVRNMRKQESHESIRGSVK